MRPSVPSASGLEGATGLGQQGLPCRLHAPVRSAQKALMPCHIPTNTGIASPASSARRSFLVARAPTDGLIALVDHLGGANDTQATHQHQSTIGAVRIFQCCMARASVA